MNQVLAKKYSIRLRLWGGANLTLVLQAVLADDLHLRIETVLLERALRLTEPEQYVCEINALFPAMLG